MNKKELIRQRLAAVEEKYGPAVATAAHLAGRDHHLPVDLYHGPITTPEQAEKARRYKADFGNFPADMSLCYLAGMNGDAADGCPFTGTEHCTCDGN